MKHLLRRSKGIPLGHTSTEESYELLALSCEHLLEAGGLLLTASTAQECDATGDAMKNCCRFNKKENLFVA